MKKGLIIFFLGCFIFFASNAVYAEHDYSGNVNFLYGSNSLNDSDWATPYDFTEFGASMDFGKKSWPFVLSVGYYSSSFDGTATKEGVIEESEDTGGMEGEMGGEMEGEEPPGMTSALFYQAASDGSSDTMAVPADIETTAAELRIGIKKIWDMSDDMHPYVGFGVATFFFNTEYAILENDYGVATTSGSIEPDPAVGIYVNGGLYYTIFDHVNLGAELGYSQATINEDYYKSNAGGFHTGVFLGYHFELF